MTLGIRLFVGFIFTAIALSFLATTGVLAWEFWRDQQWLTLASFYSHLFVFFPTFGIVALIAFYIPACVFTDMYFRHVRWGVQRYVAGFLVAVGLSIAVAFLMASSTERSVFEVSPARLAADAGAPAGCIATGQCRRLPVMQAVENVRLVSQMRGSLTELARNCRKDGLSELLPTEQRKRYCFVTTRLPRAGQSLRPGDLATDDDCCAAQRRFASAVNSMHGERDGRSLTSVVHTTLLPLKVFFGLIVLIISVLLAWRGKLLERNYGHLLDGIERGVLVGAAAIVIYPIMMHAFLQSAALLYPAAASDGSFRSTAPTLSFILGAWGLLLLFFFYDRRNQELQNLARMGGIVGSAVAIVKYDVIVDYVVLIFGSGAGLISLLSLCAAAALALVVLIRTTSSEIARSAGNRAGTGAGGAGPPDGD